MHLNSKNALGTIQALAANREVLAVEPGQVIFRSGDRGDCLYGVLDGQVELEWNAGKMTEVIGPGDTFGVGAFLDSEQLRFGTATAKSQGKLLVMTQQEFVFAVQEAPMFALEMLKALGSRLRDLKRQMQDQLGRMPL